MGAIPDLLRPYNVITINGAALAQEKYLELQGNVSAVSDDSKDRTVVVIGASPSAVLSGSTLTTTGNVTVGGKLIAGPLTLAPFTSVSTVGPQTIAAQTFALSTSRHGLLGMDLFAYDGSLLYSLHVPTTTLDVAAPASVFAALFASLTGILAVSALPLYPSFVLSWSAGTLTVSVRGPAANIISGADNGGGKLRLTLSSPIADYMLSNGAVAVSSAVTGVSLTASGLIGTPGGNGAHSATFVSTTIIDFLGVNYLAPDSFTGPTWGALVVETTPRTFAWSGVPQLITV